MASGFIEQPYDLSFKYFTQPVFITSRAELSNGGYLWQGSITVVNVKFKAIATASNSPQVMLLSKTPRCEVALSCIDITNGIENAIENSVPCGIGTDGKVYIKEITTDHIYAISGTYIADN